MSIESNNKKYVLGFCVSLLNFWKNSFYENIGPWTDISHAFLFFHNSLLFYFRKAFLR